ncbi:MAG: thiamine diphosphokinase [Firmicutes bacterium]|nr:thiamine diphosphokinase [Bacillota bacterium]
MNKLQKGILVLNGEIPPCIDFAGYDCIVCADGGFDRLNEEVKKRVHCLIGDMDSVGKKSLDLYQKTLKTIVLERDKDQTDGQMALQYLHQLGVHNIDIVGATGGRMDHIFYNFALGETGNVRILGDGFFAKMMGQGRHTQQVQVGAVISLVPLFGSVHINSTKGLKFPLVDATIEFGLGQIATLSNIAIEETFLLDVATGKVLVLCYDQ